MRAHYIDVVGAKIKLLNAGQLSISKFVEDLNKDADNFAISFAAWTMHDPQAKAYQVAGITASGLLEKYKNRPYIDNSNNKNQ